MASFVLSGLKPETFAPLFDLDQAQLAARQMSRVTASAAFGFPCRVSLVDAQEGEELLLLPYMHQAADSPFRASGPIFVRRGASVAELAPDEVPDAVLRRLISVRAYDASHRIVAGEVCEGTGVGAWLQQIFDDAAIAYAHLHYARYGCFSCRADRVRIAA